MKAFWQSLGPDPIYRLMTSEEFHFFIYAVMTYPFAWFIAKEKIPEKRKKLHRIYIICTLIIPAMFILYMKPNYTYYDMGRHISTKKVLEAIFVLAFWIFRLWLILILQVGIRKFFIFGFEGSWKTLGTIIASLICFFLLYGILKFVFNPGGLDSLLWGYLYR